MGSQKEGPVPNPVKEAFRKLTSTVRDLGNDQIKAELIQIRVRATAGCG